MTRVGNLEKSGVGAGEGGKTVLVGVNLDSKSKELLTWALVKVAQPGDRVIALHVHKDQWNIHSKDKSYMVSLAYRFDSILSVYEGFCNLKQVDLKLKICRGSSVRRTIVQEAKLLKLVTVIVGVTKKTTLGRSFISVARYCAHQLPRRCSVLAVGNGKVLFQRQAPQLDHSVNGSNGPGDFGAMSPALSWNPTGVSTCSDDPSNECENYVDCEAWSDSEDSPQSHTRSPSSMKSFDEDSFSCSDVSGSSTPRKICQVCKMDLKRIEEGEKLLSVNDCGCLCAPEPELSDSTIMEDGKYMETLVPVQKLEVTSSSISLLIKEMPELKSSWPNLRRKTLPRKGGSHSPKHFSVVQWAMQLPSRYTTGLNFERRPKNKKNAIDSPDKFCNKIQDSAQPEKEGRSLCLTLDYKDLPEELKILHEKHATSCRLFTNEELTSATSEFSPDNLIGKGGSSLVYKGSLSDGKELAFKILGSSSGAMEEFLMEIEIIASVKHPNVVSLVGFGITESNFVLVYDFLSGGSLEETLHGSNCKFLTWSERYKVAIGVAQALDYLHNGNPHPVVHRDVKSSNILLSDAFEPQLSDFGLAKWASASSNTTCSSVAGTFGYLAPEYFMHGKVNDKIDVYSFGVVLLELLSGRKPISNEYPKGQESLVLWAMPYLQNRAYATVLDRSLGEDYDRTQMQRMMLAASMCLKRAPRFRPGMRMVLKILQGEEDLKQFSKFHVGVIPEEVDGQEDDESAYSSSDIQSFLDLALLDVEDDTFAVGSIDTAQFAKNRSTEDFLWRQGCLSSSIG